MHALQTSSIHRVQAHDKYWEWHSRSPVQGRSWVHSLLSWPWPLPSCRTAASVLWNSLEQLSQAPDLPDSNQVSTLTRVIFQRPNADHINPLFKIIGIKSKVHTCLISPCMIWSQIICILDSRHKISFLGFCTWCIFRLKCCSVPPSSRPLPLESLLEHPNPHVP